MSIEITLQANIDDPGATVAEDAYRFLDAASDRTAGWLIAAIAIEAYGEGHLLPGESHVHDKAVARLADRIKEAVREVEFEFDD